MEEASVAGESPDRSKQRESSAEPTSGSAGPVPEARTAADEEPGTRGGVDTATRVLSVRDLLTEAEKSAETADEAAEDAEASGAADAGADASGKAEEAAEGLGEDGTGTEPSGTAETAEKAPESAESGDESAPGDADADSDAEATSGPQRGEEGAEAETDAGSGDAEDAEDAQEAEESGAETDGGPGAAVGDERLRAAVAAWVRSGDSDGDGQAKGSAEAEPEDAEPEDAVADADAKAADADAEPEDAAADAEPEDAVADAEPEDAVADAKPDSAKPEPEPDKVGDAKPDAKPDAKSDAKPDTKTDAKHDTKADAKTPEDAAAASGPVDQPTAIFKRPTPRVDQPTTMLKLTEPKSDPKPDPKSDPERTSKFVALKPLDDPAAKKPQPAPAEATASVAQVGPERTTQQPLPPKPPLDLLAELTNTPPPPETPVRTIVRRVKIWTPLVLLLAVVFAIVQAVRPLPAPTLDLTADESYTFDGGKADIPWPASGEGALDVQGIGSFGSSGAQKPVPIASVAKVMTTYLILRDHPLKGDGAKIKVDQTAEEQATADGESTVQVKAGDTITQREALEGVLIASANNVARLLARWDAGSEKAFASKMNAAAKDLGMTNTTYTDPSGLQKTTVSTAADQVKLAKAAMKNPSFREIARMMEYIDYKGSKHSNWNRLVGYNGVIGIKTGTTTAAGGNLVFAAVKQVGGETRTIVGAVLGQGPGGSDNTILAGALDAGDKLIRAAQGALKSATILKKGDVVGYVDDGLGGRTPVVITKDVSAVGWAGLKVKLSFVTGELPHTAKAGTKVGTLTVGDGGTSGAVQVPVQLQKDLAEPGFTDKLTRLG
ncbi:D-alanyl-D-alanine carboxypeptidase [Streptomyces gilvifuscus]|uniref:serine-type D-Ala-D-Ala carboxypeptidase n=1 Tax=Streptomyces gilvifuscus TaxID=1550617 RepID=A0ABT5G4R5_9ACTN|nr:D-alanyl-D-alanine carboxypeptidase [Streptomyces gilvifuscus]MDC2959848.1 D-alanyl-D-alanine carboxypeptidase [Streptomyces gilvifuscus]